MNRLKNNKRIKQLKQAIKKSSFYYFGFYLKEQYWKRLVSKDIIAATKKVYKKKMHTELDLENPRLLNEKVQYLKLNDYLNNSLITQLADKYDVREYIKNKGLEFLLNDIYGVYDSIEQLNWDVLPTKCAIKCTFGAGRNIIIDDKTQFDERKVKKLLRCYLNVPFGYSSVQPHYLSMERRYIVEKYIGNDLGEYPVDYKIFCMNGTPKFVEVCLARKTDMQPVFFDINWNYLDVATRKANLNEEQLQEMKPVTFENMIKYAQILSKDFKFVRVDFFEYGNTTYFSELTFTPAAGMSKTMTLEGQELFGNALEI